MTNKKTSNRKTKKSSKPDADRADNSAEHEYTDIIRFPLKLYVDAFKFDTPQKIDVVRSSYELIIQPYDLEKLYNELKEIMEKSPYEEHSIVVIGRLV